MEPPLPRRLYGINNCEKFFSSFPPAKVYDLYHQCSTSRSRSTTVEQMSIMVEHGQSRSNMVEQMSITVEHGRTWSNTVEQKSNMVEHGRTRSNMAKQKSNMVEHGRTQSIKVVLHCGGDLNLRQCN